MRAVLGAFLWVAFAAYSVAWVVVAIASNPTWWWFVPIYGDIEIFQESVWWGLFHVGVLPAVLLVGAVMSDY